MTLAELRGKVVAVTFIYTGCPDICPLLTEKMALVQDELGPNLGSKTVFVSITLDPEHDTPEVLGSTLNSGGPGPKAGPS